MTSMLRNGLEGVEYHRIIFIRIFMSSQIFPGSWGCNFLDSKFYFVNIDTKQMLVYMFLGMSIHVQRILEISKL